MPTYDTYGNKVYDVSEGVCSRTSGAWSPDTGKAHRPNVARVSPNRIYWNKYKPIIHYSFPVGQTNTSYADWLVLQAAFDANFVGAGLYTKGSLGVSFQGRDMPYYRMGPVGRKHLVLSSVVHGNESDGLPGEVYAMQLLATLPEFGDLRDEWTLFWVPIQNPDGFFLNTRNNANTGPNGYKVNLNRNYDWFWNDYIEDGAESKGAAPESEIETQNFLNYWRTGNGGGPVEFGFVFDMHANKSPGARYQSRDRSWSRITGTNPWPMLPGSDLEIDFHAQIWKIHEAIATERVRQGLGPNYMTRTLHSRFNPVLHSYFSSQGIPSMIIEEVKVQYAVSGTETYATACDFRLDYLMAVAAALTQSNWEAEDGALLEPSGTNLLTNAAWNLWSSSEYRPQYWGGKRCYWTRQPYIEDQVETGYRFYEVGESALCTNNVDITLPNAEEYVRAACSDYYKAAVMVPSNQKVYHVHMDGTSAVEGTSVLRTSYVGTGAAKSVQGATVAGYVDFLGGGTAAPATGAVNTITRIHVDFGVFGEANVGVLNTARMFHACCDNFMDDPTGASGERAWVFGGYSAVGARLTSIEEWNPNTAISTNKAAVLPAGRTNAVAVYYPPTNKIYIFGGDTAASPTGDTAILVYTPATDAILTHATAMSVALTHASASYSSLDDKIYITGGQLTDGTMSDRIYSFDPATGDYVYEDEFLQELDNEDDEEGSTRPWDVKIGRNCTIPLRDDGAGSSAQLLMLGGRLDSTVGALTADTYLLDVEDLVIGKASDVNYGYFRPNTALAKTERTSIIADAFTTGPDPTKWTDPDTAWQDGGGCASGVTGRSGWLIGITTPTRREQDASVSCHLTGGGTHPNFEVALRATFAGNTLTDGYKISYQYNAGAQQWVLYRVVGSAATALITYDVSALPLRQINSLDWRTLVFKCYEGTPVELFVTFNGYDIITYYDFDAARIQTVGKVGLYGGST